jgi:hypothetical protein
MLTPHWPVVAWLVASAAIAGGQVRNSVKSTAKPMQLLRKKDENNMRDERDERDKRNERNKTRVKAAGIGGKKEAQRRRRYYARLIKYQQRWSTTMTVASMSI